MAYFKRGEKTVEARRLVQGMVDSEIKELCKWCNGSFENNAIVIYVEKFDTYYKCGWGDWIVRGADNEFYPVKSMTFRHNFEPVNY